MEPYNYDQRLGLCENPKLAEDDRQPDGLSYSYTESGAFYVGPLFGCIHHQPRRPDAGDL